MTGSGLGAPRGREEDPPPRDDHAMDGRGSGSFREEGASAVPYSRTVRIAGPQAHGIADTGLEMTEYEAGKKGARDNPNVSTQCATTVCKHADVSILEVSR